MPDLKLDIETAVARLGRRVDDGIADIRRTAESLVEDLRTTAGVLDSPMKMNIADADAACVIDFSMNYGGSIRNVTLQLDGGHGGHVELMQPLKMGRYRAVILINKLDE